MPAKTKVKKLREWDEKSNEEKELYLERLRKKAYIDRKGFWRLREGDGLLGRKIAYNEIYMTDREKYPLEFKSYVVYHRDRNRANDDPNNLSLIPSKAHRKISSRKRTIDSQTKLEPALKALSILLFIFLIVSPLWLFSVQFFDLGQLTMIIGFTLITIIALLVILMYGTREF